MPHWTCPIKGRTPVVRERLFKSFGHALQTGAYTLELACTPVESQPEIAVLLGTNELVNHGLIDFGVTSNGFPVDKVLTITNKGGGNLLIDDVAIYGDFSFTNSKTFLVPPASSASFTARFNAATNGLHYSYLVFYNNDEDGGDGLERPFILNLEARANPAGTTPTVTLTAPAGNITVSLPTNVFISATATAFGGATITNVDFIAETGDPPRRFLLGNVATNSVADATYFVWRQKQLLATHGPAMQERLSLIIRTPSTHAPSPDGNGFGGAGGPHPHPVLSL